MCIRSYFVAAIILFQPAYGSLAEALSPSLSVTRLNQSLPIIDVSSFTAVGITDPNQNDNINGPSCLRVPDWVAAEDRAHPAAQYYLYFSHHHGNYIRMAWATDIEGPWTLFNCGTSNDTRVAGRGVLDLGSSDLISFTGGALVNNHIASPDVVIDHTNQQFILYFHGKSNGSTSIDKHFNTGTQKTLAATSATGLNFNLPTGMAGTTGGVGGGETGHGLKNAILGNAYFRTFEYGGNWYAFSNYGPIWKAPDAPTTWQTTNVTADAWTEGPLEGNPVYADLSANYTLHPGLPPRYYAGATNAANGESTAPNTGGPRHFATLLQEDGKTLEVWYTSRGEMPERIFRTTMDLSQGTWDTWDTVVCDTNTVHQEMIRPELDWEGADLPLAISENGSQENVNQLRDPYLFRDTDGQVYLFYSGEGEEAIGVAKVHPLDTDNDGMSDDDENIAGTDPGDSNSVFRIEFALTTVPSSVYWFSATGRTYRIDYSTNLVDWSVLHQDIAPTPPTNQHSVATAPDESAVFFRVIVDQ